MRILVTGGAGFLGARLAREILQRGQLCGQTVKELVIADLFPAPAAPLSGDARPVFGDNDGDGPKGPRGGHGPRGPQLTNLSLVNGVLTGTLQLPGAPVAGAQKFAVYLSIAADSANGIAAQSATPVMVTVTTAADLTPSVTATTGNVILAIVKQ